MGDEPTAESEEITPEAPVPEVEPTVSEAATPVSETATPDPEGATPESEGEPPVEQVPADEPLPDVSPEGEGAVPAPEGDQEPEAEPGPPSKWTPRKLIFIFLPILVVMWTLIYILRRVDQGATGTVVSAPQSPPPPVPADLPGSQTAVPSAPARGASSVLADVQELRTWVDSLMVSKSARAEAPSPASKRLAPSSLIRSAPSLTPPAIPNAEEESLTTPEPPLPDVPASERSPDFTIGSSGLPEWKGTTSGIKTSRTAVVETKAAWQALWQEHRGSGGGPAPKMDFNNFTIVGVWTGPRPAGSIVEIFDTEEVLPPGLVIYYRETAPTAPGSESVYPYHIWVIYKTILPITFQKKE